MKKEIIRLQPMIKTNGCQYVLLRRSEKVALYKQLDVETGSKVGYELFEIPVRPLEDISGVVYPERETYPNSSAWGRTARTLSFKLTDREAIKRFEKLAEEVDNDSV